MSVLPRRQGAIFLCCLIAGCSMPNKRAPLFQGLGNHQHAITTRSVEAQQYFDQGLVLCFGFNHSEAIRSFRAAQALDPQCAMAFWGEAFALGPNINAPMLDDHVAPAWTALNKALALKDSGTPRERAYIEALAKRYAPTPTEDRTDLDHAFMLAMRAVANEYPDDLDAQTLYAESMMDTMPWDYWDEDLQPKTLTKELLRVLEHVISVQPDHMGAIHLYIHTTEAGPDPAMAESHADQLRKMNPNAGHLIHMPSHTYVRVGRWHDALQINRVAVNADESYIAQCRAQGFYPALYYSHNMHFVWFTATMLGRSGEAIKAAHRMAQHVDHTDATGVAPDPGFWATAAPLGLVRFQKWQRILAAPVPADDKVFDRAVALYCRGIALSQRGDGEQARQHADDLRELIETDAAKALNLPTVPGYDVMQIFSALLDGQISWDEGNRNAALALFRHAVMMQDGLPYMEPPYFYYSTRLSLGSLLLEMGLAAEAEQAYRKDLHEYPNNGWGLFGLATALERQRKSAEAAEVRRQFHAAWQHADVRLASTRF